jgi:aerobic-type carbon monoxide dehydrogenase small subunit (CoxS/CutS family)
VVDKVLPRVSALTRPDVFYSHLHQVIVANADQLLIAELKQEFVRTWTSLLDSLEQLGGVAAIRRAEGLAQNGRLHPVQQAFLDAEAFQCGYCTPGMILSVKALLDKNPLPTELDIRTAIDGNLCRCGSVPNIIEATLEVSRKIAQKKGS